jgi:hypothetical protein
MVVAGNLVFNSFFGLYGFLKKNILVWCFFVLFAAG